MAPMAQSCVLGRASFDMLGLADALHQEELEKRKKLAKFADRIARIRQTDFELFQQLEQFHGLSLGVGLIEPQLQAVARDEPRRERSESRIRPIAIKNDLGFSFTGKSEKVASDPTKRIVLASGKGNSWRSFSNLSTLSIDPTTDRKVRKRRKIVGGGEDIEQVVAVVAAVLEELRLTEDDETRVIEDASEERVIE